MNLSNKHLLNLTAIGMVFLLVAGTALSAARRSFQPAASAVQATLEDHEAAPYIRLDDSGRPDLILVQSFLPEADLVLTIPAETIDFKNYKPGRISASVALHDKQLKGMNLPVEDYQIWAVFFPDNSTLLIQATFKPQGGAPGSSLVSKEWQFNLTEKSLKLTGQKVLEEAVPFGTRFDPSLSWSTFHLMNSSENHP